ncbi:unnamed protein product [Arctogadus glacialis]
MPALFSALHEQRTERNKMAATLDAEQIQCSICLDIFSKPVSIPCGHNFCMHCLATCWATQQQAQCPLCKEVFHPRPALRVNRTLTVITEAFTRALSENLEDREDGLQPVPRETKGPARPGQQVDCDVCTGLKLAAARSCQVCQRSYCEAHLRPHQTDAVLRRHKLADPAAFPTRGLCRRHRGPLDIFCRTEKMLVCAACIETDHKGHDVVVVETEAGRVKVEMKEAEEQLLQMVQSKREKVQEIAGFLHKGKELADKEMQAAFEELGGFLSGVQAGLLEEEGEVLMAAEKKAKMMVEELGEEIIQLQKRRSELEQLQHTQDHLHLLQSFLSMRDPPTHRNWSMVRLHDNINLGGARRAAAKMADFCREMERRLCAQEIQLIGQYADDVILDPDTACPWLALSPDGKQVRQSSQPNLSWLPSDPRRFQKCVCVLGTDPIQQGRHSWVVEVGDKSEWDVGVARESINRNGSIRVEPEHGYWAICRRNGGDVTAGSAPLIQPRLQATAPPRRVCVFVDYEEGSVSFYDIDAHVLLHTFSGCHFTEPLYPYFNPCLLDNGMNTAPLVICPVEGQGTGQ